MMPPVNEHITFDKQGRAKIAGTRVRITMLMRDHIVSKWDAPRIQREYGYTLGQIYAAFSYYYDHKAEIDAAIDAEREETEELLKKVVNPELQARLRALKQQQQEERARTRKQKLRPARNR